MTSRFVQCFSCHRPPREKRTPSGRVCARAMSAVKAPLLYALPAFTYLVTYGVYFEDTLPRAAVYSPPDILQHRKQLLQLPTAQQLSHPVAVAPCCCHNQPEPPRPQPTGAPSSRYAPAHRGPLATHPTSPQPPHLSCVEPITSAGPFPTEAEPCPTTAPRPPHATPARTRAAACLSQRSQHSHSPTCSVDAMWQRLRLAHPSHTPPLRSQATR